MSDDNITHVTLQELRERRARGEKSLTDWAGIDTMTDDEIEKAARSDPDWDGLLEIDWSKAVWVKPELKTAVSIRLDPDVLDFFKASGKGYQTRINAVLRHYMNERQKDKTG